MTGKPNIVYHADWGSTPKKQWCAKATLGSDGQYTAHASKQVKNSGTLLQSEKATNQCVPS